MDLNYILNTTEDHHRLYESDRRNIKVQTPPFDLPNSSSSQPSVNMGNLPPVTIATMVMDNSSSDDGCGLSPTFSTTTDGYSTDTDRRLSSGDEEVLTLALVTDRSRRDPEDADDEDDGDDDEEARSSANIDCEEEKPETKGDEPSRCQYMKNCNTGSHDYRKVISHIFGRNKKCTTQIPEECWIEYCRKHYQRTRYRTTKAQSKKYFNVQFDILLRQLTRLERWGGVRSWEIAIRKKERDALKREDDQMVQLHSSGGAVNQAAWNRVHQCKDRFLLPYRGKNKTYEDVRELIDDIQQEVERGTLDDLPGFELLPDIDPIEYPPAGASKAAKGAEDEDEPTQPPVRATTSKKQQPRNRSSSTPNRVSKPTTKKEEKKRTRHLVQASERHLKLEEETDTTPAIASLSRIMSQSSESSPGPQKRREAQSLSPVPKLSSLSAAIASSSRTTEGTTRSSQTSAAPRKKGVAYPLVRTPKVPPSPPTKVKAADTAIASSSSSHSGFRPINGPQREVAYRPATPKTPPSTTTPSLEVRRHPNSARIDTARNVVFRRIPKHVRPDVEMDEA